MSRDLELLVTKDDLLLTKSPLSAEQMQLFYQRTPADKIKQRAAKGGGTWDYVQTSYAIDTLNRAFGYMWSFEVMTSLEEAAKIAASGTCVVKGRLTVHLGDNQIVKEQFGRCEVKYRTEYVDGKRVKTNDFLDFGNDMKGAASDALKKCASELGLFRDVYAKDDFAELEVVDEEEKQRILDSETLAAQEKLSSAKDMNELKAIFVRLPNQIRMNEKVVETKDAMKKKLEDK